MQRQHVVLVHFHQPVSEGPQPIGDGLVGTIDHAGIYPPSYTVHLVADGGVLHENGSVEGNDLFPTTLHIHEGVAFGDVNRHRFILTNDGQTEVMVDELSPDHQRKCHVVGIHFHRGGHDPQTVADSPRLVVRSHRGLQAICIQSRNLTGQSRIGFVVGGVDQVVIGAVHSPPFIHELVERKPDASVGILSTTEQVLVDIGGRQAG